MDAMRRGLVIRKQADYYTVQTTEDLITCRLRGKLKRGPREGDLVAIGDWVLVSMQEDGSGMIEEVEERQRTLSRMAPTPRGEFEQIILANPDQVILVFSCAEPEPRIRMLDRFLVITEEREIPAVIVANKTDLISRRNAKNIFEHYKNIGYPLLYTSAKKKRGIRQLRKTLSGKISVLVGPSGAGKSSLLNCVQPGLGLHVREVSSATSKGRHTTVVRELFPLDGGGYVADTPGLKALALWDIEREELDGYFPELRSLVAECQFSSCTHIEEPGCAVLEAVEAGRVHPLRYDSYVRLWLNDEE
jgi:ribosome biogenesis GTPase